ncbi:MAG: hypothetical protein ACRCX2_39185 [Paraclostridium sp.]
MAKGRNKGIINSKVLKNILADIESAKSVEELEEILLDAQINGYATKDVKKKVEEALKVITSEASNDEPEDVTQSEDEEVEVTVNIVNQLNRIESTSNQDEASQLTFWDRILKHMDENL